VATLNNRCAPQHRQSLETAHALFALGQAGVGEFLTDVGGLLLPRLSL